MSRPVRTSSACRRTAMTALVLAAAAATLAGCGSTVSLGASGAGADSALSGASAVGGSVPGGTAPGGSIGSVVAGASPSASSTPGGSEASGSSASDSAGGDYTGGTSSVTVPATSTSPITVGFTYTEDGSQGAAALGVKGTFGDQLHYWQIIVTNANKHGGLDGHPIVPVYFGYNPNPGAASWDDQSESACATFTQDHHIQLAEINLAGDVLYSCLEKEGIP